ncbi:MAG: hypothetical protein P1P65_09475 [Treponema sp.]
MITSFFPGRVRLRAEVFKHDEITNRAIVLLKQSPAVKNIEYNPVTGSILLEYDPDMVPMEKLKSILPFLKKLHKEAMSYSEKKKPSIMAMLDELADIIKE